MLLRFCGIIVSMTMQDVTSKSIKLSDNQSGSVVYDSITETVKVLGTKVNREGLKNLMDELERTANEWDRQDMWVGQTWRLKKHLAGKTRVCTLFAIGAGVNQDIMVLAFPDGSLHDEPKDSFVERWDRASQEHLSETRAEFEDRCHETYWETKRNLEKIKSTMKANGILPQRFPESVFN